jgi:hypothetical protein
VGGIVFHEQDFDGFSAQVHVSPYGSVFVSAASGDRGRALRSRLKGLWSGVPLRGRNADHLGGWRAFNG